MNAMRSSTYTPGIEPEQQEIFEVKKTFKSPYNLSNMNSKHWANPTVYPMILKLLTTRGNITLITREATQEKEKENLKM